ncbi:rhomboid family intramembrane serine protease [Adhaeribacter sp. BT258]|uniref:Rhomboid family intramembrane serine protease n=1 Tax=Adhaeribacter terrigena TaxID=2793070 RepID=A0ABS1BXE1_9BACT|nr:rhomboid family intramembrane serine protease [Adhaeribacter terrigena]MBK0401754.1 rhomboid family intramembrane serine protease [Adhaeribacter terrigena]
MTSIFDDIKHAFTQGGNAVTKLILINVIVFVTLILLRTISFLVGYGSIYELVTINLGLPAHILRFLFKPWTIFTYFFTHEGFLHIIFNMLNLYWFGFLVREYLGNKKVVSLYILGGLAGGVLYLLFYNLVPYFEMRAATAVMIGASASVLAIILAAATLLPDYTFNLILLGPVRIKYIAAFLVILSISGAVGDNAGGNIAHIGGALIGFLFIKQLQKGTDLGKPIHAIGDFFGNLAAGRPKMKATFNPAGSRSRSTNSGSASVRPDQKEIDLILDKISESGYESLTKEEKQKLFRASQK